MRPKILEKPKNTPSKAPKYEGQRHKETYHNLSLKTPQDIYQKKTKKKSHRSSQQSQGSYGSWGNPSPALATRTPPSLVPWSTSSRCGDSGRAPVAAALSQCEKTQVSTVVAKKKKHGKLEKQRVFVKNKKRNWLFEVPKEGFWMSLVLGGHQQPTDLSSKSTAATIKIIERHLISWVQTGLGPSSIILTYYSHVFFFHHPKSRNPNDPRTATAAASPRCSSDYSESPHELPLPKVLWVNTPTQPLVNIQTLKPLEKTNPFGVAISSPKKSVNPRVLLSDGELLLPPNKL